MANVRLGRFVLYTFVGSFPWCLALAYVGKLLGDRWDTLSRYFHGADVVIGAALLVLVVLYLYHHLKSGREYDAPAQSPD